MEQTEAGIVNADEYRKMYEAESGFWWFVAKGRLVERLVRRWFPEGGNFLDIGCGTGANLKRARSITGGNWFGLDESAKAVGFCSESGHGLLLRAEAERLPFAADSLDGVLALDLLEHLGDDFAAADEIIRVLKPGGRVIVTAPAYQTLFGSHDEALGHFRRYSIEQVERLFDELELIRSGHFFGVHLPLMAPVRMWQRFFGKGGATISYRWPRSVNAVMLTAARLELKLLDRNPLPFGTTIFLVAEKGR